MRIRQQTDFVESSKNLWAPRYRQCTAGMFARSTKEQNDYQWRCLIPYARDCAWIQGSSYRQRQQTMKDSNVEEAAGDSTNKECITLALSAKVWQNLFAPHSYPLGKCKRLHLAVIVPSDKRITSSHKSCVINLTTNRHVDFPWHVSTFCLKHKRPMRCKSNHALWRLIWIGPYSGERFN